MKAAGYIRVSSAGQLDGHSLDAQERLFYELCKNRDWEPAGVYREEGKSAHNEAIGRRPVFRQLLDEAGRGLFDVVVVHTLDRWSRNLRVTLESLGILSRHNVSLVSITESIDYSSPQGKLFTQMLGSFAEYYSGALATHVKKGQDQRAREGRHTGGLPFGYDSCWRKVDDRREPVCDEEHPGGVHVHDAEGPAVTVRSSLCEAFWAQALNHSDCSLLLASSKLSARLGVPRRLPVYSDDPELRLIYSANEK